MIRCNEIQNVVTFLAKHIQAPCYTVRIFLISVFWFSRNCSGLVELKTEEVNTTYNWYVKAHKMSLLADSLFENILNQQAKITTVKTSRRRWITVIFDDDQSLLHRNKLTHIQQTDTRSSCLKLHECSDYFFTRQNNNRCRLTHTYNVQRNLTADCCNDT